MIFAESEIQIPGGLSGVKTHFIQRRLDYVLVSDSLQETIKTTEIITSVQSDHSAIKLTFLPLHEGSRGKAYWKFNNYLTEDKQFIEGLRNEIMKIEIEAVMLDDLMLR